MSDNNRNSVGYGRPPIASRFKKGSSGNPKGRPKGSRNITSLLAEELDRTVYAVAGGKPVRLKKKEVMVRKLVDRAMTGDNRSFSQIASLLAQQQTSEEGPKAALSLADDPAEDQALVDRVSRYLATLTGNRSDGPDANPPGQIVAGENPEAHDE